MMSTTSIAESLQAVFGQRLVAYCTGVRSPKLVGRWARGEERPTDEQAQSLAEMHAVLEVLQLTNGGDATARAWFTSLNPDLGDEVAAEVFRNGNRRRVLYAARSFANA